MAAGGRENYQQPADIALSAGSLTLNGMPANNVLVQGEINNDEVTITNLGADIARGALTGNARRLANGGWVVDNLRLSDIRLQTAKSVSDLLQPLTTLPSLALGRVDVTDARLEGQAGRQPIWISACAI